MLICQHGGYDMNNEIRDLILKRLSADVEKQDSIKVTKGVTIGIDNANDASVSGRPGFIWVKEDSQQGAIFQVFNQAVKTLVGLPVLITRDRVPPFMRVVIGVDWDVLPVTAFANETYELINHASSHEWQDRYPGLDPITVYPRAMAAFRVYPVAGISVGVAKGYYRSNDVVTEFLGLASYDLSGDVPVTVGNLVGVLIYFDYLTGTVGKVVGVQSISPIEPTYPSLTGIGFPLCYLRLYEGMTGLSESDIIIDLRTSYVFMSSTDAINEQIVSIAGALFDELDLELSMHRVQGW
jgi:hypothetical protein